MAAPSNASVTLSRTGMTRSEDALQELITQHNLLVEGVRAFATKLDTDAIPGADTNYFATIFDAAGTHPAKAITAKVNL